MQLLKDVLLQDSVGAAAPIVPLKMLSAVKVNKARLPTMKIFGSPTEPANFLFSVRLLSSRVSKCCWIEWLKS